jgi:thioredoxin 1
VGACILKFRLFTRAAFIVVCATTYCIGQATPGGEFRPLSQWQAAISRGDASGLAALYSQSPPASVRTTAGSLSANDDVAFWIGLKASSVKVDVQQSSSPQSGLEQIVLEVAVHSGKPQEKKPDVYISDMQVWQKQGETWKIVATERTDASRLQQPTSTTKQIYSESADAHAEIKEALERAKKQHKHVIVVFGANWCYDCHVLDKAFHRPDLAPIIEKHYEVVHIDIGRGEKNQDLMEQYQVPMKRGVPGLAVLDASGQLLYSQKNGEFEKARSLGPEDLMEFLNKWKS